MSNIPVKRTGIPKPSFKRPKPASQIKVTTSQPKPLPSVPTTKKPPSKALPKKTTAPQRKAPLTTKEQLERARSRIATLQDENQQLQDQLSSLGTEKENKAESISSLQKTLEQVKSELKQSDSIRDTLNKELQPLKIEHEALEMAHKTLSEQLMAEKTKLQDSLTLLKTTQDQRVMDKCTIDTITMQVSQLTMQLRQMTQERDDLLLLKADLLSQMHTSEIQRRSLHNQVMELKGNIRVFCRVRPLLASEANENQQFHLKVDGDNSVCLYEPEKNHQGVFRFKPHHFQYDKVFGPECSQSALFLEVEQLVQSALDGYHVAIFAYGCTSSGKTYTMQGPSQVTKETMGMIPRSVDLIFEKVAELEQKQWTFDIHMMYVEIYNEQINDLLPGHQEGKPDVRLLKETVEIFNCNQLPVKNKDQVRDYIDIAEKKRATGATQCNERSSRSHSIFTLSIQGHHASSGEMVKGSLHLVDLAGSERLSHSKSEGQRLKETQNINKSLSCLGDVISAIGKQSSHVPYRNSKLTCLLRNALGGNSKTLMLVNVSPYYVLGQETLTSLRFAKKTNTCEVGTAKRITSTK